MELNKFRSDVLKDLRTKGVRGSLTDSDYSQIERSFKLFNLMQLQGFSEAELNDLLKGQILVAVSAIQERHAEATIRAAGMVYSAKVAERRAVAAATTSNPLAASTTPVAVVHEQPVRKARPDENDQGRHIHVAVAAPVSVPPAGLGLDEGLPVAPAHTANVTSVAYAPAPFPPVVGMTMGVAPPVLYKPYDSGVGIGGGYAPSGASSVAANSHAVPVSVYSQPTPVVMQSGGARQDSCCWTACQTIMCCLNAEQAMANSYTRNQLMTDVITGRPASQNVVLGGLLAGRPGYAGRVGDAAAQQVFCADLARCVAATPAACNTVIGLGTACCGLFGRAVTGCTENVGPCLEGTGACLQATIQNAGQVLECCGAVGACCCGVLNALSGGRN